MQKKLKLDKTKAEELANQFTIVDWKVSQVEQNDPTHQAHY